MPDLSRPLTPRPTGDTQDRAATLLLRDALKNDREGNTALARDGYEAAIKAAAASGAASVLAEALRRLGGMHHRANDGVRARELCNQSYEIADRIGNQRLAAEALNALGVFELEGGSLDVAEQLYRGALTLADSYDDVRAGIEQNLGVLANIRGDLPTALTHYERSLEATRCAGDQRGCAIAYHNLGMISADQRRWTDAEQYFRQSLALSELVHDAHLSGLCRLNQTEVYLASQRYEDARRSAEDALSIFNELHAQLDKADAYKMLGVVFREIGRPALAESRLQTAIQLAVTSGAVLSEAEASRELAVLYQVLGRNQEALTLLNSAYRLFYRIDARRDIGDVASKVARLEGTYLAVVRDWGQSIESADSYTHGHCERVASYAQRIAEMLGLNEAEQTTIRLGAYLHDLGKVRVPHEILNKPGPLTPEEFDVIKRHPLWGLELLAEVEFPWDLKPIIRSHHEKFDGTGYPDGLRGQEIPLAAQIICVVDVYDALTTTRSYRPAMSQEQAFACMQDCRSWWRPDVFDAFCVGVIGDGPATVAGRDARMFGDRKPAC